MVNDVNERNKILKQMSDFHYARSMFGCEAAKNSRKDMLPAEWWDFYGDMTPELKRFAIRVLSLTCSSSGCERNWSSFEMVHTKRRNRLHQKKMNNLVYVMYNLKLKSRKGKAKGVVLSFEDIHSDDEWITEDPNEENVQTEVNVDQDDVIVNNVAEDDIFVSNIVQSGGGGNVELGGSGTPSNPNLVNDEEGVSSGAEFDDNTQETDEDDGDDIGGCDFTGALDV
ncbi:uncharacterized protein LOC131599540 [Vicia villosa]|uniref:uncharacterized protein LOC131599540 n=1 Tax=Vicia villosa TaxID=3911 RepID=UPI00273C2FF1|nr:uncharacterized protein LOC131599540 [Vicia villosa]